MPTTPSSAQQDSAPVTFSPRQAQQEPPLLATLWDMDGTLVDTEPYWIEAETALVKAHGGHWDQTLASQLVGSALDAAAVIFQNAGVDLSVREIIDHLSQKVIEGIKRHIPWRPGAQELLAQLNQEGIRCVLVTMSEGPLAREVVAALDQPYFEFMVTGDQVANGKPHPEPYLTAVERLKVLNPDLRIENCVALEDSVPGVASALAAGVRTIAIPNHVPLANDNGSILWESLAGKTVADVQQLLAASEASPGTSL